MFWNPLIDGPLTILFLAILFAPVYAAPVLKLIAIRGAR